MTILNMKFAWIFAFLIYYLIAVVVVANDSFYSIVAPGTLKSNRRYSVVVTLHDAAITEPALIQVKIEGPSYRDSKQVRIGTGEIKQLDFMPPKLEWGFYYLLTEGLEGVRFKNESMLNVDAVTGPKIYIQTNKDVYKPKELVQFRVVILDEHTRPVNISEPIRVKILDANGNRVKQFKDINLIKGVFTGELKLSEHQALGFWKILVIISGRYSFTKDKFFEVKKYVLPKFKVEIKTSQYITPSDRSIKAFIFGKYTFDKYVQGNVSVTLWDYRLNKVLEEKQLNIDHVGSVEFQIGHSDKYANVEKFALQAVMTEKQTGNTQENTVWIPVHKQQYKIEIPETDIEYRKDKPYRIKAKIKHWSDVPVLDTKTPVYLEHGNRSYEAHLNDEGIVTFEFDYDSESSYKIRYKDSNQTLSNIFAVDALREELNLKLKGGRPRLGKMLEFEVSSDTPIPYMVFMITSHANIILWEYITPADKTLNSHVIQIKPSIEMIPRSNVYVHFIQNGNLRYKELSLDFPFEFENQVSVLAPKQVAPGSEVTLNIRAQPQSYVCLLAVDLSVYILDPNYDLNGKDILFDLYNDMTYTPFAAIKYPGILSGLITLTNAHYPSEQFNIGGHPSSSFGEPSLRDNFPETWIFKNLEITQDNTELTVTIPDTITTWRITAFTIHDITGFGIVDEPTDIVTIKPFFVNLNLPYSLKKGEILDLPITVFNYHNESVDAEITMHNSGKEFDFIDDNKMPMKRDTQNSKQLVKKVKVPMDGVESVRFMIKPKTVGEISLHVTGVTQLSSDAVEQKLLVEPEGAVKSENKAMLLKMDAAGEKFGTLRINIPEHIVPESEHLSLAIGGNTLASTMKNLNGLVLQPTGCGEQNMVNFAPNVLVLQYLRAVGKLKVEKELVKQAMQFVELGYQQELAFRHANGGFSAFGEVSYGKDASTWLTAYVIRFFIKASKFAQIEERIIASGLDFLANKQLESGEFPFTGYLFYPAQQNRFGFTAFVLQTFLENKKYANKYKEVIDKGVMFLNNNMEKARDVYALSIMAVSLQMAKSDSAQQVLEKLQKQSKQKTGLRWWSADDTNLEKDVEITAYAMMALLEAKEDCIDVLKWLTEQRNSKGGFKSTHDTVVGLQALVKYSESNNDTTVLNMNLKYIAKNELGDELKSDEFVLDGANSLELQSHALPHSTRSITFNATGSGQSVVSLSSRFYVATGEPMQHFHIDPKGQLVNENSITLDICFVYQPTKEIAENVQTKLSDANNPPTNGKYSNMVIMEVNLPTGFRSDAEFSNDLLDNELIQRIESKNSESIIVFYLDNLLANERNCLSIEADRTHNAMNLKATPVVMYDYYNNTRRNTMFYTIENM